MEFIDAIDKNAFSVVGEARNGVAVRGNERRARGEHLFEKLFFEEEQKNMAEEFEDMVSIQLYFLGGRHHSIFVY